MFVHTDVNGVKRKFANARAAKRFMADKAKRFVPEVCPDDYLPLQVFDRHSRTGHNGPGIGSKRKPAGIRRRWQTT